MSNPNYKIHRTLSDGNTKEYSRRSLLQEPVQKMSNPNYKIHRTLSGIEKPRKYPYFGKAKINHHSPDAVLTKYGKRFMFSSIVLSAIMVYNERDKIFS